MTNEGEFLKKDQLMQWITDMISINYQSQDHQFDPGKFLIEHGVFYESVNDGEPKGPMHACFHTAALKMLYDPQRKTKYVEGIQWHGKLSPIYHGWNVVDGQAVDYTITPTSQDIYFGVSIPNELVVKAMSNAQKTRESDFGVLGTLALYKNSLRFLKELEKEYK